MGGELMIRRAFLAGFCALSLTACQTHGTEPTVTRGEQAETVVFLVRHAEKEKGTDPGLTLAGIRRAEALGERLSGEGLTAIYSTDYARTRETAQAVANATGLKIKLYDPSALPAFAEQLKASRDRVLVVGHSNTTPALVTLLGGTAGTPIEDATEFDRLYTVKINGTVATQLESYGN